MILLLRLWVPLPVYRSGMNLVRGEHPPLTEFAVDLYVRTVFSHSIIPQIFRASCVTPRWIPRSGRHPFFPHWRQSSLWATDVSFTEYTFEYDPWPVSIRVRRWAEYVPVFVFSDGPDCIFKSGFFAVMEMGFVRAFISILGDDFVSCDSVTCVAILIIG